MAKINGTNGDDILAGTSGKDRIRAKGGDDIISAGDGDDKVWGGKGDDTIYGGAGDDKVWGGKGNDVIDGGDGDDKLWGDEGDDTIDGGAGDDKVWGGKGNDVIDGGGGDDKVWGGKGDDTIGGGAGSDKVWGGKGNDIIDGGDGDDILVGGAGDDSLSGGAGDDILYGDGGNGSGSGSGSGSGWGDDYLDGGAGDDLLVGGLGDDTLLGGDGNDVLFGDNGYGSGSGSGGGHWGSGSGSGSHGSGSGSAGSGSGSGAWFNDYLEGGAGSDLLFGQRGVDTGMYVAAKNVGDSDYYDGGRGIDTLQFDLTIDQWLEPVFQADLDTYLQFLTNHTDPGSGEADDAVFQFTAFDLAASQWENLQITVDGIDLDPVDEPVAAVDDADTTDEDTPLTGNVLANDSVPDLVANVEILNSPVEGDFALATDGSFTFDPGMDFQDLGDGESRQVFAQYRVTDADGDSDTATVAITVTGSNDAPIAEDDSYDTDEDTVLIVPAAGVLVNDDDPDNGDAISVTAFDATSALGASVVVDIDGAITYDPTGAAALQDLGDGESAVDTFSYTIIDQFGETDTATVQVTVTGLADTGPTIVGNSGTGTLAVGPGVVRAGDTTLGSATVLGDTLTSEDATIGSEVGSDGMATVSGSGIWAIEEGNLTVGRAGTGELRVESSGQVVVDSGNQDPGIFGDFRDLVVGGSPTGVGSLVISGTGSRVETRGTDNVTRIGLDGGDGTLLVEDGGTLDTFFFEIARNPGSTGAATITGAGSSVIVSTENGTFAAPSDSGAGFARVGRAGGEGELNILDGGRMEVREGATNNTTNTSPFFVIGRDGATGTVLVDGNSSVLAVTSAQPSSGPSGPGPFGPVMLVGQGAAGMGTLAVSNGGAVEVAGEDAQLQLGFSSGGGSVGIAKIESGGSLTVDGEAGFINFGIGGFAATSGTMTVDGVGSSLSVIAGTQSFSNIGLGGTGELHVSGGATASFVNSQLDLGGLASGAGTVTVIGAGSTLTVNGSSDIGIDGSGTLLVADGGTATIVSDLYPTQIGAQPGGTGVATITGAGSTLDVTGDFFVGSGGDGTLDILDGGAVVAQDAFSLGFMAGSSGTVVLDGAGSTLEVTSTTLGFSNVGIDGDGTMTVSDGGTASYVNQNLDIGSGAGSTGTLIVDGAGSSVDLLGNMAVGASGTGELRVENGGQVIVDSGNQDPGIAGDFQDLIVGGSASGVGSLTITGAGSRVETRGTDNVTRIGLDGGDGTLLVEDGGTLDTFFFEVGRNPGSTGAATISGAGSSVIVSTENGTFASPDENLSGFARVGRNGADGELNILDGGRMEVREGTTNNTTNVSPFFQIGRDGATGTVLVDGIGSELSIAQATTGASSTGPVLQVGRGVAGDGSLTVRNDGAAEVIGEGMFAQIGGQSGATGALNIESGASMIFDGLADSAALLIADSVGASGSVSVDGGGSILSVLSDINGFVSVGRFGTGSLNVTGGGAMTIEDGGAGGLLVAENADATGTVTVDGAGSSLSVINSTPGFSGIGLYGAGTMDVTGGASATFTNTQINVGTAIGGVGNLTINGTGSSVTVDRQFHIGDDGGTGTVLIEAGGSLTSGAAGISNNELGVDAGSSGAATVTGADSTWNAGALGSTFIVGGAGDGELNILDGGSVVSESAMAVGREVGGTGRVLVDGAGSVVDVTAGGLINLGFAGTASLTVTDGGLVRANQIDLWDGDQISGDGTIEGMVNLIGGTVSPGASVGTLTVDGSLDFGSGATLETEVGGIVAGAAVGGHDLLDVSGFATLGAGTMIFSFIDGFAPLAGDSFHFVESTGAAGAASSISIVAEGLAAGFAFDPLVIDGTGATITAANAGVVEADTTLFFGAAGSDTVEGGVGDDVLDGGGGDDTIIYTVGDGFDIVDGGSGDDTVVINGVDGAPTVFLIEDGATYKARTGDLSFLDDHVAISANGVLVMDVDNVEDFVFNAGDAGDTVVVSGDFSGTDLDPSTILYIGDAGPDNIDGSLHSSTEHIEAFGFGASDTLTGGAGNDLLDGGADDDQLYGGTGDDVLIGGSGVDTIDGGDGTDTARFAGLDSEYTVTPLGGGVIEVTHNATSETDTLTNIENVAFDNVNPPVAHDDAISGGGPIDVTGFAYNPGNGHYYKYVEDPKMWIDAENSAVAMGGYLASVMSAAETDFVRSLLESGEQAWLGAQDLDEGVWKWESGPESGQLLTYFNWSGGEPNDGNGGNEDNLLMFSNGKWNDGGNSSINYMVELEVAALTDEDTSITIDAADLLGNDSDVDPQTLSIALGSVPATSALGAALTLVGGDILYDPSGAALLQALNVGEVGIDSFTYRATDGGQESNNATVRFTITGLDEAPVFGPPPVIATTPISTAAIPAGHGFNIDGGANYTAGLTAVGAAGDVDGDGLDDLIVGASSEGPSSEGASFVVFGGDLAAVDLTLIADDLNDDGFILTSSTADARSGFAVSGGADVNGDGFDDVIVGAPYDHGAGYYDGIAQVVHGRATDGTSVDLDGAFSGFPVNGYNMDRLGWSVSDAGDVDGDGFDDVIVGAPFAYTYDDYTYQFNVYSGAAFVVFGDPAIDNVATNANDLTVFDGAMAPLPSPQGFAIKGLYNYGYAGASVGGGGDVNGDGFDDLVVGAVYHNGDGKVFVVFGKDDDNPVHLSEIFGNPGSGLGFVINGDIDHDSTGISVDIAGDVNGDGYADLILGAPEAETNGNIESGAAYVIFGDPNINGHINLTDVVNEVGDYGFIINGASAFDFVGGSVSGAGDVNGDGLADMIVGGSATGESYVIFGRGGTAATELTDIAAGNGGFLIDGAGGSVGGGGDVNGDGFDDVIVDGASVFFGGNFAGTATPVSHFGTSGDDHIVGTNLDDNINGAQGNDTIEGGPGIDLLAGAAGDDLFVFDTGDGQDTIRDFDGGDHGGDMIDVSTFFLAFAEVQAAATDEGQNVHIDFGGGDDVTLLGLNLNDLVEDDFLF